MYLEVAHQPRRRWLAPAARPLRIFRIAICLNGLLVASLTTECESLTSEQSALAGLLIGNRQTDKSQDWIRLLTNNNQWTPIGRQSQERIRRLVANEAPALRQSGPMNSSNAEPPLNLGSGQKERPCDRLRAMGAMKTEPSEESRRIEDEAEGEQEADDEAQDIGRTSDKQGVELMSGNESVALLSAMRLPSPMRDEDPNQSATTASSGQRAGEQYDDEEENDGEGPGGGGDGGQDTPPDEAAERREQEAAEASEAEAADRSALAEQQQAQREIILAQAQSEAKAIREQQEALLRQQQLQQQILMRRHQNFLDNDDQRQSRGEKRLKQQSKSRQGERRLQGPAMSRSQEANSDSTVDLASAVDLDHHFRPIDNQFSDHLDKGVVNQRVASASMQHLRQQLENSKTARQQLRQREQQNRARLQDLQLVGQQHLGVHRTNEQHLAEDEMSGDYSMRLPQHSSGSDGPTQLSFALSAADHQQVLPAPPLTTGAKFNLSSDDLLVAAQHRHYGAHDGSFGGSHKGGGGYYQFAESHKKGQFESGFKRGNKKFSISGHSSQHKGHAEGHVKWQGKKGKGTHYWNYKHKNKKHYGGGDGYGGGHHYY